jgi:hypothetical protein
MNFYHRNSIFTKDRGYRRCLHFEPEPTPENLQLGFDAVAAAGGGAAAAAAGFGPGDIFFAHAPFGSNGSSPAARYTYSVDRSSFFNYNQFAGSYPDLENYGGFVTFTHKLFGEQMVLMAEICFIRTRRRTTSWRLARPGIFRHPARSRWPFHRRFQTRVAMPRRPA